MFFIFFFNWIIYLFCLEVETNMENIEITLKLNLWQRDSGTISCYRDHTRTVINPPVITFRDLMINQCKHLLVEYYWFLVYYGELINAMNQFDRVIRALDRILLIYSLHFNILVYVPPTILFRSIILLNSHARDENAIFFASSVCISTIEKEIELYLFSIINLTI